MVATIKGYKVDKEIGLGGMATVYLAVQESLDRNVALKVLSPELTSDPSFGERFLRETRIIAKLPHPNIVPVFDAGVCDNQYYLAMELLDGDNLTKKMKKIMTIGQAIQITIDIAKALEFAHNQGFIHRDIKPDNILFKKNIETAVLSDFGIARPLSQEVDMTTTQTVIGSPKYMSPEQALADPLNQQSDIFSLGVVFYQLLTGQEPYKAKSIGDICVKHETHAVEPLQESVDFLQPIIDKMLAISLDARYLHAADIIEDLTQALNSLGNQKNQPLGDAPMADGESFTGENTSEEDQEKSDPSDRTQVRGPSGVGVGNTENSTFIPSHFQKKQYATISAAATVAILLLAYVYVEKATLRALITGNDASIEIPIQTTANTETASIQTTNSDTATGNTNINQLIDNANPRETNTAADQQLSRFNLTVYPAHAAIQDKETGESIDINSEATPKDYQLSIFAPGYQSQNIIFSHPTAVTKNIDLLLVEYPTANEFASYQQLLGSKDLILALKFLKKYPDSPFTHIANTLIQSEIDISNIIALAEQGDPVAQFSLGEIYDSDVGGLRDKQKAALWSKKSSDQKYPLAQVQHALFLLEENASDLNSKFAMMLLKEVSEKGFFLAQTLLAEFYFTGNHVEQDKNMALSLFNRASVQGDSSASASLSNIYKNGYGVVEPDPVKADYYARMAKK